MARRQAKGKITHSKGHPALAVLGIMALTLSVFSPSVNNSFTNWDDEAHLTEYLPVRALNLRNIQRIFSGSINKTYIPLTPFSFALEYHFFGLNPFVYHLDNILLHAAVTVLVFLLGMRLGLSLFAAGVAAVIFGIHPMRVESVAWVTERKGLLYALFFLLAMRSYWQYILTRRKIAYILSLFWGLLSILSKPMALSLPLIFFLLDWWAKRPFKKEIFLEKIPHLIYIVPVTLATYLQHARMPVENLDEGLLIWVWTFIFYLRKFIYPGIVLPIYRLPPPISLANASYSFSLFLLIALIFLLARFYKQRWLMFAFIFYLASIFFMLRMDKSYDLNAVADRYMYLPSLGLCFLAGFLAQRLISLARARSRVLWAASYISLGFLLIISANYSYGLNHIWKNSLTLWSHIIEVRPDEFIAYNNRGIIYAKNGQDELAVKDFDKAIAIYPKYDEAYNNRGNLFKLQKQYAKAILDFSQAILHNPKQFDAHNNRACALAEQEFYEPALADLDRALKINPGYATAYFNRGNVYSLLEQNERAIADYNNAIEIDPYDARAYNNRGTIYHRLGMLDSALADFNQALRLNPHDPSAQYNRLLILRDQN